MNAFPADRAKMASNCTRENVTMELDKAKGNRATPRIDANLIMNLSTLITAENQDTYICLRKITQTLSSSLKKYAYESDEFVEIKHIFLKLIHDCFLRIPLILEHSSGQQCLNDLNTDLKSIVKVLLDIANNGEQFRNYYFMNLFQVIILALFSRKEKIKFATQKILFLLIKVHIIKLWPRTQKYLMYNSDEVLELLATWLPRSADYEIQEAILEILMAFSASSKQKYIEMKEWFKNFPSFYKAIDNLDYDHFIVSSREFLIEVNKQITNNVKVYILPCVKAYADDVELEKPKRDLYKEFWIDFSVRSGHIQVYCAAGEVQWAKISIDFSNVNCISNVNENSEWKVKIELICPLLVSLYSSTMNIKTITLYFPCSLKFLEVQNNFFLIVFPHIYKIIENDHNCSGSRKHLCDKVKFERSFFSRSSVISSIRPVAPHRANALDTSWSASVNVRTSTPKGTNDAGMENQKRKTSRSNNCNVIDTWNCDVEDRKMKSNCQQLFSSNQSEVNLSGTDETITPSVASLQQVGSNKFRKVEEQSDEICFSTPTGEIDCETINNGLNLLQNTQKNNIQRSNKSSWPAGVNVRTSTPKRADDAGVKNQKRKTSPSNICNEIDSWICDVEDRKIKSNCQQLFSSNQNEVNLNGTDETITPSVASLQQVGSNKFTNVEEQSEEIYFSTPTGEIDCETINNGLNLLQNTQKSNIQHSNSKQTITNIPESACTNVNKSQNYHEKTNNKRYQEDRNISIENINMVQSSDLNIDIIYDRSVSKKCSLGNNHLISNFSTVLGGLQSVRKESFCANEDSVRKRVQTNLYDKENFNYKTENNMKRNFEKNNVKYKMNGHKPRSYLIDYNRLREIKELGKNANEIRNLENLPQRSNHEFKKTSSRIEEDKIKISNYTFQDDRSESGRKKELNRDASEMKRKSQKVEQESRSIEIMKETYVTEEEDKIKGYDSKSYVDNQFERGRTKQLDNDTIKKKTQRVEENAGSGMKKAPSVNDTSLIKNKSEKVDRMKNASRECVEEQEIKVCYRRSYQDNQFETEGIQELDNDIHGIKKKAEKFKRQSNIEVNNPQDFGFSVLRPVRTYSKLKYPQKSSVLDNTLNRIFDSIRQKLDGDKENDSINLSNDSSRSRRGNNKRKLYTPGKEVHLGGTSDKDYEKQQDDNKKVKLFVPKKNVNNKKYHSSKLFDDVSEADRNGDCIERKHAGGTSKSNNMRELRNLPRKCYKDISTEESGGSNTTENTRKNRKLQLTSSPKDQAKTSVFDYVSSTPETSKKRGRKLLSYTRTKYGKPRTSNKGRNKTFQKNKLFDDREINSQNNNEAIIINEVASNEELFTDNISASTSKNDLKDPDTNVLTKENKKKMLDGIARLMINARNALNQEIMGLGKQYYDSVNKLQFIITNVENQLKQVSSLCSDIENITHSVNKAVSQPVSDKELRDFVGYLKENDYYLQLSNEQGNDRNLIAKINAYFDSSKNSE